jgi:hypothetical protein
LKGLLICLAIALPSIGSAEVIVQNLTGNGEELNAELGQTFTTPSGGPWDDITFTFYSNYPPTVPTAAEDLYLFSEVSTGLVVGLESAPGLIGHALEPTDGVWAFAPNVTLQANTEYWVYDEDSLGVSAGSLVTGEETFDSFGGPFAASGETANFSVDGTAVPEPSNIFFALTGLLAIAGFIRYRRPPPSADSRGLQPQHPRRTCPSPPFRSR